MTVKHTLVEWLAPGAVAIAGMVTSWFAMVPNDSWEKFGVLGMVGALLFLAFRWITGELSNAVKDTKDIVRELHNQHMEQHNKQLTQDEQIVKVIQDNTNMLKRIHDKLEDKKDGD